MGAAPAATGLVKGKKARGAVPSPAAGRGGDPHASSPSVSPSARQKTGGASAAGLRGLGASGSAAAGQGSSLRARDAAGAAHGRQRSAGHESEMLFDMEPEEGYEKPRSPAERGGAGGGSWGGRGAGLEADLGAVRDLLHLRTPVEQTLGEAAGAAMDVTPGSKGSPQEICDRLRALGFRATKIGRSRRTADVLRSPRHSFVVVDLADGEPMVVDPNFKAHLQVARPSPEYKALLQALPERFVGSSSRMQKLLRLLGARLQESFEQSEMPIPPWRGSEYLTNIWAL